MDNIKFVGIPKEDPGIKVVREVTEEFRKELIKITGVSNKQLGKRGEAGDIG